MPFFPEQELERLRRAADIVQIVGEKVLLKKSGQHFKGLCPFHQEKTPSFTVNPSKQIYYCFGCSAGGDVFSFLMKCDGSDFVQTVLNLADRFGIELTPTDSFEGKQFLEKKKQKEMLFRINALASEFFAKHLKKDVGQKAQDYLKQRAVREEVIEEASLGYAPADGKSLSRFLSEKKAPMDLVASLGLVRQGAAGDTYDFFRDRLIFPIISAEGKVLGFSGRALNDELQPKYLNSPESPIYHKSDSMLGLQMARSAIRERDQVVIVEGNFDMLRLQQEGLRNVVAPLGTSLTDRQIRFLSRITSHFVLLFDGDAAGLKASHRALPLFLPLGISPRVVFLPTGEDPDSFVRKKGIEPLKKLLSTSASLMDWRVESIFAASETSGQGPEGQSRALKEVGDLIHLLPSEVEKRLYIQRAASRLGLPESLLLGESLGQKSFLHKESNLRTNTGEDNGTHKTSDKGRITGAKDLPPLERTVVEIVLLNDSIGGDLKGGVQGAAGLLFQNIQVDDFSNPSLREIWGVIREDFEKNGSVDLARLVTSVEEGPLKKLIMELAMRSSQIQVQKGGQEQAVKDCIRQWQTVRLKGRLKSLSVEIRQAETKQDFERMRDLLSEKNQIMKEMTVLH